MQLLGTAHTALAVACLFLGAIVLYQQKGGRRHRVLGYLYAGGLLLANLSALSVYEDSPGLGPFHILALISLATRSGGFAPALFRYPRNTWLELHAYFMSWSYVGLVGAGAAQMATMFLGGGLPGVVIPTFVIVLTGALLIHTRLPKILSRLARKPPVPIYSHREH